MDRRAEALADTNASLELVGTSHKALGTRARAQVAPEDHQAAVNGFRVSLEHVCVDGSQAEERA